MDHQLARSQTGGFGDEIIRSSRGTTWPHEAVAQDVPLADDRDVIGLETGFDSEHTKRDGRLWHGQRLGPVGHRSQIVKLVIRENVAHALTGALAPQRNCYALARGLQREHMRSQRLENVCVRFCPFGSKIAALPRTYIERAYL